MLDIRAAVRAPMMVVAYPDFIAHGRVPRSSDKLQQPWTCADGKWGQLAHSAAIALVAIGSEHWFSWRDGREHCAARLHRHQGQDQRWRKDGS